MGWEMFDRDAGAGFEICGVDGDALADAPLLDLPVGCEITITAESAAPAVLEATERDLEHVTASLAGRIVATTRTRTTLVTLVYLPGDEHAHRYSEVTLPKRASISVAPAIDPDWTLFDARRPVGIEEQSMLDFRVRTRLHAAGDRGGARPVEHVVVGLTEGNVDDFTSAVSGALDSVRGEALGDVATWRLTHVVDPNDVTESSWIIRQIAERHGARYVGWDSAVMDAAPSRPTQGNRWFRRPSRR